MTGRSLSPSSSLSPRPTHLPSVVRPPGGYCRLPSSAYSVSRCSAHDAPTNDRRQEGGPLVHQAEQVDLEQSGQLQHPNDSGQLQPTAGAGSNDLTDVPEDDPNQCRTRRRTTRSPS